MYIYILIIAFLQLQFNLFSMENNNESQNKLTFTQNIAKGSLIGLIDVSCTQPLYLIKNNLQQGRKALEGNFYRGLGINALNTVGSTAIQITLDDAINQYTRRANNQENAFSNFFASFLAGGISAFIACPKRAYNATTTEKRGCFSSNNSKIST